MIPALSRSLSGRLPWQPQPPLLPLNKALDIDMKVWIQHADFSEEEFELDLESTLRKFVGVDWLAELTMEEKLVKSGDESCPPGLGIVHAEQRILHICPGPSGTLVHFHYPHKVIGLLSRRKSITIANVRPDQIKSLIHAFFDQKWELIKSNA